MSKKFERWRKKEENRLKKLILMRLGVIAAAGFVSFGGFYFLKDGEKTKTNTNLVLEQRSFEVGSKNIKIVYQEAQRNKNLRQNYIDQILNNNESPFVSGVIYAPNDDVVKNYCDDLVLKGLLDSASLDDLLKVGIDGHLMKVFLVESIFGKHEKQPIFVSKEAFDWDEVGFTNMLFDHEFIHAEDIFNGIKIGDVLINYENVNLLQAKTLTATLDLRALFNQMRIFILKYKNSPDDKSFINSMIGFSKYYKLLENVKPKSGLEGYIVKKQLELYKNYLPEHYKDY